MGLKDWQQERQRNLHEGEVARRLKGDRKEREKAGALHEADPDHVASLPKYEYMVVTAVPREAGGRV